jgi:hypothetical protein
MMQQRMEQLEQSLQQSNMRASQLEYQQSYYLNPGSHTSVNNVSQQQINNLSKIISKPENFNGNTNTLDLFIFSMRNYLLLSNVPPHLHVQTAGTFLTGNAGVWFAYLTPMERSTLTTFDQLATLLTNYFSPLDQQAEARRKLASIKQTSNVNAFNNIFNQTVQRLPNMEMQEKIEQYRRKLNHALQVHLALTEYTTLNEIMKAAVRIESLLYSRTQQTEQVRTPYSSSTSNPFRRPNSFHTSANKSQPNAVAAHHVQMEEQPGSDDDDINKEHNINFTQANPNSSPNTISKLTPEARQHCIENKLCFRCRKSGHNKFHCPLNSSNRQQNSSFQPTQQPSKPSF